MSKTFVPEPRRIVALMLVMGMALSLLSACGFQLKGQADLPDVLNRTYISGLNDEDKLRVKLARQLEANGVDVVDTKDKASALFHIYKKQRGRRVLSVGSNGKAREYEVFTRVTFDVKKNANKKQTPLLSDQTINLTRDYVFDEDNALAGQSKESLLYKEMQGDIIRLIIYRLQSIKA